MTTLDKYIVAVIYMEYVTVNALLHHEDRERAAREVEFHVVEKCLELSIGVDMVLLHASASVNPVLN